MYLGRTSYAFYMVQAPVILMWRGLLADAAQSWPVWARLAVMVAAWLVNLGVAHLLWSAVEEPARRRLAGGVTVVDTHLPTSLARGELGRGGG